MALTDSAQGSALHVDGHLAALGAGVTHWPEEAAVLAEGFAVGSDGDGLNLAQGPFDELATFAQPLTADEVAWNHRIHAANARRGPISPEEEAAWLLQWAQAEASTLGLLDEGEGEGGGDWTGCTGLSLRATNLGSAMIRFTFCGREPGQPYDLLWATNLTAPMLWHWLAEISPATNEYVITDATNATRFYCLATLPDADGDGLRDWLYPEQQGLGFVEDDDNDNDGIPNAMETAAGRDPNNPASLPPPSFYVSAGAAAGGDGSRDLPFQHIQTALNAASNYSVIQVRPGVYSGVSNRHLSFGAKKLVLVSERGWESTVMDCGAAVTNRGFVFTNAAADYRAQVIGFTVSNAAWGRCCAGRAARPPLPSVSLWATRTRPGAGPFSAATPARRS